MRCLWLFILEAAIIQGIKVIPQRSEVVYANPKYIINVKTSVRRHGRGSGYYLNFSGELVEGIGNNITAILTFYEVISGNYVPLPIHLQSKMCDFLNKEKLVGKMIMSQLPKNMSACPFQKGWYPLQDLNFDMGDLPFDIPFTFSSVETATCIDLQALGNEGKELAIHIKIHVLVIQKPRNRNLKIKHRVRNFTGK